MEQLTIRVAMSPDEAVVRIGQALQVVDARNVVMASPVTAQGSMPSSTRSPYGEHVSLTVAPADPSGAWITIDSRSLSRALVLTDLGKNAANTRRLAELLTSWDRPPA